MSKIVFFDLETTGLSAHKHEIWECGAVLADFEVDEITEYHWHVGVTLINADPTALEIGKFEERYGMHSRVSAYDFIGEFGEAFAGLPLAANNVAFDMSFIKAYWFRFFSGRDEPWHYSPIDVKSFAAGALRSGAPVMPKTSIIGDRLGVSNPAAHTALADARFAHDVYKAALYSI